MLKKILTGQLRLGMHVHEFCGSWLSHPFWRSAFMLDNEKDLKTILSAGITELWIDTSKGLDVEIDESAVETAEEIVGKTAEIADEVQPPHLSKAVQRVGFSQETERAAQIIAQSKQAVTSMFHEARMGLALNAEDALPIVEEISNSILRNPGALISLTRLKNKDDYTYMHSVAVCALMVALARQLGLDEEHTRQAGLAGLMHDIGKMAISQEILNKPGKLTNEEYATVKNHPVEGHKLLSGGAGIGQITLDVCLHHHEKVDGSGYPDGLAAEQISLDAKMGAVCDVYDAITSNRPYKSGWEPAESLRKMAEWSAGHFDPVIFQAFVKVVGIYPVGSLVRLESNRLGAIIEQTDKSLLTPVVMVFFSIKSNARIPLEIVDLSKPGCHDKITSHENPLEWKIRDFHELWSGITPTW